MATWDKQLREYTEHRWVVKAPAHHTDISQAIQVATRQCDGEPLTRTSVVVQAEDDTLVISYTVWRDVQPPFLTSAERGAQYAAHLSAGSTTARRSDDASHG